MADPQNLELKAQQAILQHLVERYKQQSGCWFTEPALKKAILLDALCGWPTLVLVAAFILVAAFLLRTVRPAQIGAAIIVLSAVLLGLTAEIVWLWAGLKDEQRQTRVMAQLLKPKLAFSLAAIRDKRLKIKLYKALQYWSLIDELAHKRANEALRDRFLATNRDVTHWLQTIYKLAAQVDDIQLNPVARRDLQNLPGLIQKQEQALAQNNLAAERRQQLEPILAQRRQQLRALQNLQEQVKQAHHQLDQTLSALGVIYAQLLLVVETGVQGNRVDRLQTDITAEVDRLQDLSEAMAEVYQSKFIV